MRRIVLGLLAVGLLGGLTGCRTMTTGVCDCACLPPPVYPPPAHAGKAMLPGGPPPVAAPVEQINAAPVIDPVPQVDKLPNR